MEKLPRENFKATSKMFLSCVSSLYTLVVVRFLGFSRRPRLLLRFSFALSNLEVARLKEEEEETPKENVSKRKETERSKKERKERAGKK